MATITSVNNTTVGATYNIHDTATWIGGVVPGPNDTVVFQSATATTWYLTQDWTIQGISMAASANRSESGIEVPDTVTQDITFTQTVSAWTGSQLPMTSISNELRTKPWLKVNNPVDRTFVLNLPGNLLFSSTSLGGVADNDTSLITCTQAGTAIINVAGVVMGHVINTNGLSLRNRNAVAVVGATGYTEVNCAEFRGGYNAYSSIYSGALSTAVRVSSLGAGGSVELNASLVGISAVNTNGAETNGSAFYLTGSLANGVTLNATTIRWARTNYGNIYDSHTSGTLTINGTTMGVGTEPWEQGYNENYDAGNNTGTRRTYYCNANNINSVTIFNTDIYGPNNIYNSSSNNNYNFITTGLCKHYIYGNIYTSYLNRYQVPFYYDNDGVLFYHMEGTIYNSLSSAVFSTRSQYLSFTGGFYHANVVQSNDALNIYAPSRVPFVVPCLMPNPNYTGGDQMSWTYVKSADNRAETTTMVNANYVGYSPAESNVRLGTVYGNGLRTGTCAVPQPSQVYLGAPVDNTVGTLTAEGVTIDASLLAGAIWNYDLNEVTNTTNGAGQRLLNNATIESTGEQIAALGV